MGKLLWKRNGSHTLCQLSEIIGLDRGIENIWEEKLENVLARHEKIASATRKAFTEYGLKLYLEVHSNTVTAVKISKYWGIKLN